MGPTWRCVLAPRSRSMPAARPHTSRARLSQHDGERGCECDGRGKATHSGKEVGESGSTWPHTWSTHTTSDRDVAKRTRTRSGQSQALGHLRSTCMRCCGSLTRAASPVATHAHTHECRAEWGPWASALRVVPGDARREGRLTKAILWRGDCLAEAANRRATLHEVRERRPLARTRHGSVGLSGYPPVCVSTTSL